MTGPEGNSEFCFPRISMFLELKSRETLRFEGNKIHCSPRDQSLSDLLYSKTNKSKFWKTRWDSSNKIRPPAITCKKQSKAVIVICFPLDVIVFVMLPTHGIWRETVSLLDVMWPWTSQHEKCQLYNNVECYCQANAKSFIFSKFLFGWWWLMCHYVQTC